MIRAHVQQWHMCSNGTCARFDSKLVRLEVNILQNMIVTNAMVLFQFQTGAIRRLMLGPELLSRVSFQFQTGAIRSSLTSYMRIILYRFNSKLVRLEVH